MQRQLLVIRCIASFFCRFSRILEKQCGLALHVQTSIHRHSSSGGYCFLKRVDWVWGGVGLGGGFGEALEKHLGLSLLSDRRHQIARNAMREYAQSDIVILCVRSGLQS